MTATITVNLVKLSCNWCEADDVPAPHAVTDNGWVDYVCDAHLSQHFDVLKRYDVTFTKRGEPDVCTFTWAKTYEDAYTRTEHFKAKYADLYAGWAFDVAYGPSFIALEVSA